MAWTRIAAALRFKRADPLNFILAVGIMNCLAAAGCMAVPYWITLQVTCSWKLTTAVSVTHGLTTAFLAHTMNMDDRNLSQRR